MWIIPITLYTDEISLCTHVQVCKHEREIHRKCGLPTCWYEGSTLKPFYKLYSPCVCFVCIDSIWKPMWTSFVTVIQWTAKMANITAGICWFQRQNSSGHPVLLFFSMGTISGVVYLLVRMFRAPWLQSRWLLWAWLGWTVIWDCFWNHLKKCLLLPSLQFAWITDSFAFSSRHLPLIRRGGYRPTSGVKILTPDTMMNSEEFHSQKHALAFLSHSVVFAEIKCQIFSIFLSCKPFIKYIHLLLLANNTSLLSITILLIFVVTQYLF